MHGLSTITAMNNKDRPRVPAVGEIWRSKDARLVALITHNEPGQGIEATVLRHPASDYFAGATIYRSVDGLSDTGTPETYDLTECIGALPEINSPVGR